VGSPSLAVGSLISSPQPSGPRLGLAGTPWLRTQRERGMRIRNGANIAAWEDVEHPGPRGRET
jgi:hypothetical protein